MAGGSEGEDEGDGGMMVEYFTISQGMIALLFRFRSLMRDCLLDC